jgi:hypothetical protein
MEMHGRLFLEYRLYERSRCLGCVVDLAVADGRLALVAETGGTFRRRRLLVPWTQIRRWEVGRVEVEGGQSLPADAGGVLGRRLAAGTVVDLAFSPETGRVEGIVLSRGVLRDLLQGRTLVPYVAGGDGDELSGLRFPGHGSGRA